MKQTLSNLLNVIMLDQYILTPRSTGRQSTEQKVEAIDTIHKILHNTSVLPKPFTTLNLTFVNFRKNVLKRIYIIGLWCREKRVGSRPTFNNGR